MQIRCRLNPISRRGFVLGCGTVAATGPFAGLVSRARAQAKLSKAAAGYQTTPNGAQSCARCAYCVGGDGCSVVEGPISPHGWCRLFLKP